MPYAIEASAHLRRVDPVMVGIIDRVGPLRIARRRERFVALARAMIFQQLAGAAANAILERFIAQIGGGKFPKPEMVLKATAARMRKAGISRQKNAYLKDLARRIVDGEINFHRFARMSDDDVIEHLTRVKGIGRWTAEIFLMFNLGRPDVCPADDLGIRNAVTRAYGLKTHLKPKELREFGERWRPYRSAAAWYLWRSLAIKLPDGE
jgi:DNA-3-methyladenine glycosylase II